MRQVASSCWSNLRIDWRKSNELTNPAEILEVWRGEGDGEENDDEAATEAEAAVEDEDEGVEDELMAAKETTKSEAETLSFADWVNREIWKSIKLTNVSTVDGGGGTNDWR